MTFDDAIKLYQSQNPGVNLHTTEGQDAFNAWSGSLGPGGFEAYQPAGTTSMFAGHPDILAAYQAALQQNTNLTEHDFIVDWANSHPEDKRLDDPSFIGTMKLEPDTTGSVNAESVLGKYAMDQAQLQIAADAQRKADAANLVAQYQPSLDASRRMIGDMSQTVDWRKYFADNPDVAAAFEAQKAANPSLTPEKFASDHWQQYGQYEGRATPVRNSALLDSELAASKNAQTQQLMALNTQVISLSNNLSGELAGRAANLQKQIETLTSGLNTFTAAERASHAQQVASQLQALETEVGAKRQAIQTQLTTMGNSISAHDVAMRSALQTELNQLNAAQEPLNQARISSAETLAASVNLGAQSQQDAVRAEAAQAGYIGSSTGTDMAIARAAIGGRQQAAEAMGAAKVANATDTAGIGKYGAQAEYGIAGNTADANQSLGFFGANENRTLSDASATGRRTIADFNSAGVRTIDSGANTGARDINTMAANDGRALADYGVTGQKNINDFGANETRNISDSAASRGLSYFNTDLQRRLAALSLPGAAIKEEINIRTAADNYGNSGYDRAISMLQPFRTNGTTAPNVTSFTGNQGADSGLSTLGGAIVGAAGNVARAANYWKSPSNSPSNNDGLGGINDDLIDKGP